VICLLQNPKKKEIEMSVRSLDILTSETTYCTLIDAFNGLCCEWKYVSISSVMKCPSCCKTNAVHPSLFPISQIEQSYLSGTFEIPCGPCQRSIPFSSLVPDLQMVYYQGKKIQESELTYQEKLGEGGFADVFKGLWMGKLVAIKKLREAEDMTAAFQEFRKEICALSDISSPYCLQLYAICFNPFLLITEFIQGVDMYRWIHEKNHVLTWDMKIKSALDVAEGMHHLHSKVPPIMHLDLKSPNILMASYDPNDKVMAKVIDFGTCSKGETQYSRHVDNPIWSAPEVIEGQPYNKSVDIYSYGVCLYELATEEDFFGGNFIFV